MSETEFPYTFTLLAPAQDEVFIQIDALDWKKQAMEKNERGEFFWNTALADGVYRYRFHLPSNAWFYDEGTWVDIIDPLATEVDLEENAAILRLEQGMPIHSAYAWEHDDVRQLSPEAWVLYELHVGVFSADMAAENEATGSFAGCTQKISYLEDLGITGVQLLPVQGFPGEISLGYNPAYFLAPASSYGRPEDLMAFVDALHGRHMVCLGDFVFNHASDQSPLAQIDHDYWFHHEAKDPEHSWGPEFNYDAYDETYDRYPAWEHAQHVIHHWLYHYHFDGLRYDAVKQLDHRAFLEWSTREAMTQAGPKIFFNIAECIPDEPSLVAGDGPMNACWHDGFCQDIRRLLSGETLEAEKVLNALDGTRKGYETPLQIVNYLSNHDQPRLHSHFKSLGLDDNEALRRHHLGIALLFFAVGIPMVRMGEEMAWDVTGDESPQQLPWERLSDPAIQNLWVQYQTWIQWWRQMTALQRGEMLCLCTHPLWVLIREDETSQFMLAFNPTDAEVSHELTLDHGEVLSWTLEAWSYDVRITEKAAQRETAKSA